MTPLSSESDTTPENGNESEDNLEYLALATQVLNGSLPHDNIAYMSGMQVYGSTNGESTTSVLLPLIPTVNLHTISPFIYGTPPDWKPIRIARIAIPIPTDLLEKVVMAPPSSLSTPSPLPAVPSPTPGSGPGSSPPPPPTQELDRPAELPVPKTESDPASASNTAEFECQKTFLQSPPASASLCSSAPTQVISTGSGDTSVLSAYDSLSASDLLSQPNYELSEKIIEKMEAGEDNRTSLKIRHIPHSVTIDQLEEMIKNVVGPRKIDFLHLPRFKNGGEYSFVATYCQLSSSEYSLCLIDCADRQCCLWIRQLHPYERSRVVRQKD